MFPRFIFISACSCRSSFSQLENILLRDLFSLFMHYPTHGNTGCSQFLFISKNAVRIHLANTFFCTCSRVSLGCIQRSGIYSLWDVVIFSFAKHCQIVSQVVVPICTPTCIKGTPIAPHFPQHWSIKFFSNLMGIKWYLIVILTSIFFITNELECIYGPLVFCPLFYYLFLIYCYNYLFSIVFLCWLDMLWICAPSLETDSSLSSLSFNKKKFLILM